MQWPQLAVAAVNISDDTTRSEKPAGQVPEPGRRFLLGVNSRKL
jgi:hypothetical protein